MLESDFEELLDDYLNGSITDKDFLTLVSAASSNPRWKKRFEDAEKMLEMSSSSFLDKGKTRFKAKVRGVIENIKSSMRRTQSMGGFFTSGIIYFFLFVVLSFVTVYTQVFYKNATFALMIVFFQIIASAAIIFLGVYVFFYRGKD